jgi:hypothetical protein
MDMTDKLNEFLNDKIDNEGYAYSAGYFTSMMNELFSRLSEDQQKEFLEYHGIILTIR